MTFVLRLLFLAMLVTSLWSCEAGLKTSSNRFSAGAKDCSNETVATRDPETCAEDKTETSSDEDSTSEESAASDSLPAAPASLSATGGVASITLSWPAVKDASGYNLYWSTTFPATKSSTKISGVTSPYVHVGTNVVGGTTYYYAVAAAGPLGEGPLSDGAQASAEIAPPPGAFMISGPVRYTKDQTPTVTWTVSAESATYTVEVATDPTCATVIQTAASLTSTEHTLSSLDDGEYFLCVRAQTPLGGSIGATNNGYRLVITQMLVLGQGSATTSAKYNGGRFSMEPDDVFYDGTRLFAVDRWRHRILIWNAMPTSNNQNPDVVLGQPDFDSDLANHGGISAKSLYEPRSVFSDGAKLYVADYLNNRVLIWNTIPTLNFQPADIVLGQPDSTSNTANNGGRSAKSLNGPAGITKIGSKLAVAEWSNHRILVWNSVPTADFAPADVVIGQADMTAGLVNSGGISDKSLSNPSDLGTDGTNLLAADVNNHRVLIWSSVPTSDFSSADVVLGQPNTSSGTANNGGIGAARLSSPSSVCSDGVYVYVTDSANHRVLRWNAVSVSHGEAASMVLGQTNFSAGGANEGGLSAVSMNEPISVHCDEDRVLVAGAAMAESSPGLRILRPTGKPRTLFSVNLTFKRMSASATVSVTRRPSSPTALD